MVNAYDYDSYGRPVAESESFSQPFRFTGREWGAASELYHYRARNYDPSTGRFIQDDPIGFAAGDLNLQRYVGNNPLSYTGPSGLTAAALGGSGRFGEHAALAGIGLGAAAGIAATGCEVSAQFTGLASLIAGTSASREFKEFKRTGVCTEEAEFDDLVLLFRVVGDSKLRDLRRTGRFAISPRSTISFEKQFVRTKRGAEALQEEFKRLFGGKQTIAIDVVPKSVYDRARRGSFGDISQGEIIGIHANDVHRVRFGGRLK